MPVNDRSEVMFLIYFKFFQFFLQFHKSLSGPKVTSGLVYLDRFLTCSSVVYVKYTPSSQVKNRRKLYDPDGNIYY